MSYQEQEFFEKSRTAVEETVAPEAKDNTVHGARVDLDAAT